MSNSTTTDGNQQQQKAEVHVRLIEPSDAKQAAQVWCDGLQQTIDHAPEDKREEYATHFAKYERDAMLPGGTVGPDGAELVAFYHVTAASDDAGDDDRDCRMFVAVNNDQDVLGLVGVKRGMSDTLFPKDATDEDYGLFSIWKMSVAEKGRRLGIGCKLMEAAEGWVRTRRDAKAIRLHCGNPLAIQFYTKRMGYAKMEHHEQYGTFQKEL